MSLVEVVLFEVHGRRCAVPVSAVREVFAVSGVTPVPTAPASVRGLATLHGQVLPLVDLGAWLPSSTPPTPRGPEEAIAFEAPLDGQSAPVRAALAVDRVLNLGSIELPAAPGTAAAHGTAGSAIVVGPVAQAGGATLLIDPAALVAELRRAVLPAGEVE